MQRLSFGRYAVPVSLWLTVGAVPALAAPEAASPTVETPKRQIVSGQVVDENDKPLSNVPVLITLRPHQDEAGGDAPMPPVRTQSDANGHFATEVPYADTVTITGATPGHAIAGAFAYHDRGVPFRTLAPVRLQLRPLKSINFRVVTRNDAPVAGAVISLRRRAQIADFDGAVDLTDVVGLAAPITAVTGADGRALLPFGAAGDRLVVLIEKPGLQTINANLVIPDDDGLSIRLVPGVTVKGRLVDWATGQPRAGLRFNVIDRYTGRNVLSRSQAEPGQNNSDATGRFTLTGLDEAGFLLKLQSSDHVAELKWVVPRRSSVCKAGIALGPMTAIR